MVVRVYGGARCPIGRWRAAVAATSGLGGPVRVSATIGGEAGQAGGLPDIIEFHGTPSGTSTGTINRVGLA
jgi:hypothetical protein